MPTGLCLLFVFFNDTATTEIYTLSLHDALPILSGQANTLRMRCSSFHLLPTSIDRKSTRLNSSHLVISYAVFCLKQKTITYAPQTRCKLQARILGEGTDGPIFTG